MKKITKDTYLSWYEDMLFWRKFEDKLAAVYIQQKVRGFLHLYNGQRMDLLMNIVMKLMQFMRVDK